MQNKQRQQFSNMQHSQENSVLINEADFLGDSQDYQQQQQHLQVRQRRSAMQQQNQQTPFLNNQLSVSSIQSPIVNGGIMNVQCRQTIDEEDDTLQQEPTAFGQPPVMMQQSESFPFNSEDTLPQPYYFNLKRVQEGISNTIQGFPVHDNQDFFDYNYEKIIETSATQIEFLFNKLQQKHQSLPIPQMFSKNDPSQQQITASFQQNYDSQNVSRLMAENTTAQQNIQMLKTSLNKADEIVKNLRIENEYFQRQLEALRHEMESTKINQLSQQTLPKTRSLDRNSKENSSTFMISAETHNFNNYNYEPQMNMPQPMPHPRSNLPQYEMQEDPFFARRQRDLSATPTSNSFNVVGPRPSSKDSRENVHLPQLKRPNTAMSASASSRRGLVRKALPPFTAQATDQNQTVDYIGGAGSKLLEGAGGEVEQELKTARFEISQQGEVILLKTETIANLQNQLDQQKRRMTTEAQKVQNELTQECEALKKELELCKNDEVIKEASMQELKRQVAELFRSKTVEMNVLINKPPIQALQMAIEEQSAAKPTSKAQMNNKASKNLQFAKDLNEEMELMFADDDFQIKPVKKQKRKDTKNKNRQTQQQSEPSTSIKGVQPSMLNPQLLLQNQIQAAQLTEELINEISRIENGQTTEVSDLQASCQSLEVHAQTMIKEKTYLAEKVTELSKVNDDLKRKFSSLLDQFQEYVTLQEQNKVTEEDKAKQQQEALLTNMQNNIKELETVTESLQNELQNKEDVFEALKKEKVDMQEKLEAKTKEESDNSKNATQRLQDELGFLKKHHELEINMLKEQYERSLETAKLIAVETAKVNQNPPPSHLNQDLISHSQSVANRSESVRLSDNMPFQPPNHCSQQSHTPMYPQQLQVDNSSYYQGVHGQPPHVQHQMPSYPPLPPVSPNLSNHGGPSLQQMHQQHQYQQQPPNLQQQHTFNPPQMFEHHHPVSREPSPPTNHRSKEILNTTNAAFEKMKKDLVDKEHLLQEKNREILHLRMTNEEQSQIFMNKPQQSKKAINQIDSELRGQLVQDLTYSVSGLRMELNRVKQTMFVQIGKHINFDAPTNLIDQNRQISREEDLHSEIIIQLSEIRALVSLAQEIAMLAQSSLTATKQPSNPRADSTSPLRNPSPNQAHKPGTGSKPNRAMDTKTSHDTNYQIKRNADQMLRQNHASGLHELVLEQVTRSETLMSDNQLMQRQLYKYETTLAELDVILRTDKRDQANFELKKLVENQLKQIMALQKEVEIARSGECPENQSALKPINHGENVSASLKELEALKYELREQRMANEELISERRNLMEMVENQESQVKESNRQMDKALSKVGNLEKEVQEKTHELEDIRERVTKVAELFERKEIKQKYSFEVLCDFVHDKAKRLFSKYDNLAKERKVMQEEKNFYFQRKLDQLEQENFSMKETNRAAERIIHEMLPNLAQLLDRPMIQNRELSEYYFGRQVLEQLEIEFRTLKKSHNILQERNDELRAQMDAFTRDNIHKRPPSNYAKSSVENCAPNLQRAENNSQEISYHLRSAGAPSTNTHSNQYHQSHQNASRGYEQRLSEATEHQEIKLTSHTYFGGGQVVGRQISGEAASPTQGHSPLRSQVNSQRPNSRGLPDGQAVANGLNNSLVPSQHTLPTVNKEADRNIRDSPPAKLIGTSATPSYQGMMGSHLPSAENKNK